LGYSSPLGAPGQGPALQRGRQIRVMVVDDSLIVRAAFSRLVDQEADLELAAAVSTAEDALTLLASERVDVILLDLEMPGMGGLGALPQMIERAREAKIMVVSSLTADGAEQTVEALALGAADTLQKPATGGFDREYKEKLLAKIRALGRRPLRKAVPTEGAANAAVLRSPSRDRAAIVAIGASTGGIHSIGQLFGALPTGLGIPILITQHLPVSFIPAFAQQLRDLTGRETFAATEGMALLPDGILIAPGDAHLTVVRKPSGVSVRLERRPAPSGCMPSVDPMFASIAEVFGSAALGVVLTGMGRDGTLGAQEVAEAGGTILVQNEATSAVWGMPGSIARAGLASAILHPLDIAGRIATAATGRSG
jgi:two-component system, chemotaxis family, protein-glutamate methylesterase/glutaminase